MKIFLDKGRIQMSDGPYKRIYLTIKELNRTKLLILCSTRKQVVKMDIMVDKVRLL